MELEEVLIDNLDLNKKCISNPGYFPLEVIMHIFEYLSYQDRVAASQVCSFWYEASLDKKFLMKEKVVFKKISTEDILCAISTFETSNRPYLHFLLIQVELNSKIRDAWIKLGPVINSLSMEGCDIGAKTLVNILSNLYNLECLEINNCRELLMAGRLLEKPSEIKELQNVLKNLKELNLGNNRYLSDVLFNRLISIAPNLESFSLAGCQVSFHLGVYKRFYPDRLTENDENYASETVLTFKNILKYLESNAERIREIDLSKTLIDSRALNKISQVENLKLKQLYLMNCEQISNAGIINIAELQTDLIELNLSSCSRVTDQALICICNSLVNLTKLGIRNCRAITDLGVSSLKKLVKLEEIDLSQCEKVSGLGIEEGLCNSNNKRLKKLYLAGLNAITPDTVIKLAKCLPNITHLNLSYCINAVTDKSVQAIIEFQTLLRSLQLVACTSLTDAGLTGMGLDMENDAVNFNEENVTDQVELLANSLNGPTFHISLRSPAEEEIVRDAYRKKIVQKICESRLKIGDQNGHSLKRLKGLQELNLACCNRITDVSLEYALCLPELQYLNLSKCQQVTHVGLKHVGINNRGIVTLNLNHCYNITDEGIAVISKSLGRLRILNLQGCNQLTDASKKAIAENCKNLRYLDVRLCPKMTSSNSEIFNMPSVHTFHFSDGGNRKPVTVYRGTYMYLEESDNTS